MIAALFFRSNFENAVECLALRNSKKLITITKISSEDAAPSYIQKFSVMHSIKAKVLTNAQFSWVTSKN